MNKSKINLTEEEIKELEKKESSLYPEEEIVDVITEKKTEKKERKLFVEDIPDTNVGKIELNKEILPSLSLFYPHDSVFLLSSARIQEIRNFSTYMDKDAYETNKAINEILKTTVHYSAEGKRLSSQNILEIDKLFFLFAIRDLTFYKIPNVLTNISKCPKCGESCGIEIFSNNTNFVEFDMKWINKYYNPDERNLTFDFKDGESLKIKPPTIQVTTIIDNYIKDLQRDNKKIDYEFIKNVKFLDLDWELMTTEKLNRVHTETYSWSFEKFSLFLKVISDFKSMVTSSTFGSCTSCGAEVSVPFRFQGNLLSTFLISDPYSTLR